MDPFSGDQKPIKHFPVKKIIRYFVLGIVLLVFASVLFSSFYTVAETEQAVITTFGRVTGTADAGLHFKLPWPIQQVYHVPVNRTQKLELGYRTKSDGTTETVVNESKMITGDMNIIEIDFFFEWKIDDPVKYLFSADRPESILQNLAQSSVRAVIGGETVDNALTTGKTAIQTAVRDHMSASLEKYDIGIRVLDVKVQDSQPPTDEVIAAFKNVETAKQQKETYINQALEYKNQKLPEANSEADRILRAAESKKQERINEALGQVARFNSMYAEYVKNPEITRTRMYLEMIEEVLPGVKVYIDAGNGSTQKLLPLESFADDN